MENCCEKKETTKKEKGFLKGILYGILPHAFCIAFIIFTILSTTIITSFLKPILLNPYFFYILIGLSFSLATISAVLYLKRNGNLSAAGARRNWKYLSILYGTTISVNLILFMVIFPLAANFKSNSLSSAPVVNQINEKSQTENITLEVQIPCSGHASLIIDELYKIQGVESVKFRLPNLFDVIYDSTNTSENEMLSLEVFNTYKAKIIE